MSVYIHESADVQTDIIGENTTIWQNCVILKGARIGTNCNINAHCLIEGDVTIGDNVTIKSGVYIWNCAKIGNNVFIGPNVSFSNDKFPRSKQYPEKFQSVTIEDGASLGSGAILLPGVTVGSKAMVGAGSVVTHNIPPHAIAIGNPARITGYVTNDNSFTPVYDAGDITSTQRLGVGDATLYRMKRVRDLRGNLTFGEFPSNVPFIPKRYFVVYDVPSSKLRGGHAHKVCKQFLLCITGSVAVVVDNGTVRKEVLLDSPELGLYIPPLIYGTQYKYTPDASLLVFASEFYEEDDYIRDYNDFLKIC